MQYRKFTKDHLDVSLLGFGCMRFPVIDGDSSKIDEELSTEMLHYAIDYGVNYIDTAYNYHQGNSEIFVGKALKNGYREKVYLATKLPVWLVKTYEDFERLLDEQLEKMQVDYIDFYLLHSLYEKTWRNIEKLNVFKFIEEAKRKGKIKYIGFSFHDELPLFKEIVDAYPWDFCQIQLNYMDRQYQAGIEGLQYISEKSISLVIMEPIKGGKLASAPSDIEAIWDKSPQKRTPAEWALKWIYDFKEVSVVLSGMSTLEQVKQNITSTTNSTPMSLTENEHDLIDQVTALYNERTKVGCTSCEYCIPCPSNVAIPNIFSHYNNFYIYGTEENSMDMYEHFKKEGKDSTMCTECGACEQLCPQHLEIISLLKDANKALSR